MSNFLPIAVAFALLAPVSAQAADTASPSASPAQNEASLETDKLICRKEKLIGTRLGSTRICLTSAQWAAKRAEERRSLERVQTNRPLGN